MKKTLHIIPGWGETCRRNPYKKLKVGAEKKGYSVLCHNVDWKKPLTKQIFPVAQKDLIFGFSLGAILGLLTAQKYECKHIILASMTPRYSFKDQKIKKALVDLTGYNFTKDICEKLKNTNKVKQQTIIYGEMENEPGDILISKTNHELNDTYISEVLKII